MELITTPVFKVLSHLLSTLNMGFFHFSNKIELLVNKVFNLFIKAPSIYRSHIIVY